MVLYNETMTDRETSNSPDKYGYDINESLLTWKSLSHPYKKRSPLYGQTILAFALLISIVSYFIFSSILLIGGVLSTLLVVYLMSTLPPVEVEHKITPSGFINAGKLYHWQELYSFWFEKKWEYDILVIQTRLSFPGQVRAVLADNHREKIRDIVGKYLVFNEHPQRTFVDKLSDFITQKLPLETS
ncbi:hypothetical protein A3D77_01700 [Candidatus Gottesmanbacteria bacterium RIFCSPHIGHO2_02_FULL_39_11]|uniref:DUF5673 domain-containing protein n=1 Tax=Candidatus Gottesmanbacteria bacterium RIFCSPHIGHO2_02_FULL_39_11 TaxID=1798382 RepID=A0A1F5ZTH3_9BACT|nr:MAG: hypothetical protein A3D77_01700 [Candidatus Gottesmanbacteria bacterium RIFCSPHIGHO2_02_FULL_39_11]